LVLLNDKQMEAYARQYYNDIFRYCMWKLNNREDAKDATQEAFLVFSIKGHLIDEKHVRPWLYVTANYMVLRMYRKRQTEQGILKEYKDDVPELVQKLSSVEEDVIDLYGERYIEEIYSRFNEKERMLYDVFKECDGKTALMARALDITPHACSMRKKRLKDRCREIMLEIMFI